MINKEGLILALKQLKSEDGFLEYKIIKLLLSKIDDDEINKVVLELLGEIYVKRN